MNRSEATALAETIHGSVDETDRLIAAAYSVWRHNRHDILGALDHVAANGISPDLRALATQTAGWMLGPEGWVRGVLWRAFESEFAQRDANES